ncbi:unnamed protein product [Cuscuta campestris]|uniref:Uncharacterized protein n=1 Tax=Cuscuta campestris TaxID=132261 RepID=A0A484LGV0_9ASTE|nr:unnamed protein product [Cuscuta campestris]
MLPEQSCCHSQASEECFDHSEQCLRREPPKNSSAAPPPPPPLLQPRRLRRFWSTLIAASPPRCSSLGVVHHVTFRLRLLKQLDRRCIFYILKLPVATLPFHSLPRVAPPSFTSRCHPPPRCAMPPHIFRATVSTSSQIRELMLYLSRESLVKGVSRRRSLATYLYDWNKSKSPYKTLGIGTKEL